MKNKAVLKKFGSYCGYTALMLAGIYSVIWSANRIFGDPAAGIAIVFSIFGLFFLWHMAETRVLDEERQKRWEEERLQSKKMLTE